MLCQGHFQLLLKIGFAGSCKERHFFAPFWLGIRLGQSRDLTGNATCKFNVSSADRECTQSGLLCLAPPATARSHLIELHDHQILALAMINAA